MENADEIVSTEAEEVKTIFTKSDVQQLRKKCDSLIEGVLENLLLENAPEQEFYNRLWMDGIYNNPLLQNEKEKEYALYRIWQDRRIPYFQLDDGMTMSNETYTEYCNKNKHLIKKAFFIINSSFPQRSQQGDLLLRVMSECETFEDKVVVMAQILGNVETGVLLGLLDAVASDMSEEQI
ncbi:MAG: hypothetical protein NC416_12415 [Eubacterium sp.]|nr:hypothetical protein [Eubacterium sp.]